MHTYRITASLIFLGLFWSLTCGLCYSNYHVFGYYHKEWAWPIDTIFFALLYTPFTAVAVFIVHAIGLTKKRTVVTYAILLSLVLLCVQAAYVFDDTSKTMGPVFFVLATGCCGAPFAIAWRQ